MTDTVLPQPRRARVVNVDGVYYATCPYRACRGRSELGVWAIAHLHRDTLTGPCQKCGKPIKFGREDGD